MTAVASDSAFKPVGDESFKKEEKMKNPSPILRSGWVKRLSHILKRWKDCWLVAYDNGALAFFETPDQPTPEEVIIIPYRIGKINMGHDATVKSDDRSHQPCVIELLEIGSAENVFTFITNTEDDALSWRNTIEDLKALRPHALRPGTFPQGCSNCRPLPYGIIYDRYGQRCVVPVQQVYVDSYPYPYYDPTLEVGAGLLAGAAFGSLLCWPFCWPCWPILLLH